MAELKKTLTGVQFFSIGFGGIVGVGWIVYMGIWFNQAGPMGTVIAFLVGGLLMSLIGLCYAEAGSMFPVAGGEATYAYGAFGGTAAFVVGWAMVLMMTAVIPYVSVSLAWILDVLFPGIGGPTLYTWRGQPIRALGLVIALVWTAWMGVLNYRGIRGAARFQDWLTYGKIAISVLFVVAGIFKGSPTNLQPLFQAGAGGSVLGGIVAVLATTPWFFGGFNEVPQMLEEKSQGTSVRMVGMITVLTILAAAAYYAIVALATGMVGPWQQIATQELPAAAAFRMAFGSELMARIVLVAGLFGIVTVGNAASIAGSRLLLSLGRARSISPRFAMIHPQYGSPVVAILFMTAFGLAGSFLGRGGIAPIVGVGATAGSLAYLFTSLGVWRLRLKEPNRDRPYRIPAGVVIPVLASVGGGYLLFISFQQQWIGAAGGFPLEWVVMIVWAIIGAALYHHAKRERVALGEDARRRLVFGE